MTKADKEGQRKAPILRFKGFTDDWEQRKLGEIGKTYSGLTGKNKSDFEKGNSNFVTFLEVLNNPVLKNIDLTNKVEIKENEHQNKVKRNDILFNTSSETPEEVATSTVVDVNQDNLYLNSFCFGFRPNVQFSNYYIGYYLRSNHFRSRVFCLAQGISRYNISKKSLIKLKLSLPKLEEQDKISRIFNQIELLLTLYERKKELLKKFQQGFSDILFKKNPKECVSLGDYFYFNKGKNIGNKDLINNGKYYAIVYGELYTTYNYVISKVFSKTSIKGFKGRKNDLLFPSSSTVPFGTATCSALEIDNIELGNDIIVARPKNTNELDSAFISYQINSKRKILYPIISGTTITHMYSKDLSKIRIWLPNITTQNYISNILQRISHLNILVDKKVNILKEIKKEFLNTMFI